MKLTLEDRHGGTFSWESNPTEGHQDSIESAIDALVVGLLAVGYQPGNVADDLHDCALLWRERFNTVVREGGE